MSVRIHELAKRIEMDNKELLALLKGRGYEVKTASSTIDPISAESIEKEFLASRAKVAEARKKESEAEEAAHKPHTPVRPPQGAFVKSAADIEREHAAAEAAKPKAIVIPPPGMRPAIGVPPRPRPAAPPDVPRAAAGEGQEDVDDEGLWHGLPCRGRAHR